MPLLRDTLVLALGLAGAAAALQAPEFAQQYRQRLGGALFELQRFVADFDADASHNGLTRDEALARHVNSADPLFRDRGTRAGATIAREEALASQAVWFDELPPMARPLALTRRYDGELIDGAWRDFEPALPLTAQDAVWGIAGFGVGAAVTFLLGRLMRPSRWRQARTARRRAS